MTMAPTAYQHSLKRLVDIFRSPREEGLYLYVDREQGLAPVPDALLVRFGKPSHAMTLLLEPGRKLARAEALQVLQSIESQGYYLQLPPLPDQDMFALRAQNHKLAR